MCIVLPEVIEENISTCPIVHARRLDIADVIAHFIGLHLSEACQCKITLHAGVTREENQFIIVQFCVLNGSFKISQLS